MTEADIRNLLPGGMPDLASMMQNPMMMQMFVHARHVKGTGIRADETPSYTGLSK
jgi:hypothetical protein